MKFANLALGLMLAATSATGVCAETLGDAVALAYQTNPALQAERARLRALNETYVQARSGFGPRVTAELAHVYQHIRSPNANTTVSGSTNAPSVSLTQSLFSSGRLASAVDAAEAGVLAGRERLLQVETNLLEQVIAAYVAVRRDQQIVEVLRGSLSVLRDQFEETRAKVEVRENTRTDLAQAEGRLAGMEAQLFNAEAQLVNSRAQYLNVVGQNPGQLEPEPDLLGLPETPDEAFRLAEDQNHELLMAKFEELASRARVREARAQNLPTVNLRVQAARSPNPLFNPRPFVDVVTAQAVVSQPLFTAGLNGSGVRRALELNTAERLDIDAARRTLVQAVAQQWAQLATARRSIMSNETYVTSSETAFFGMREEERFGLRTTIELLNAQQELASAQIALLRNRATEYATRAALLNLTGELRIEALAPDVPPYDPEADFDRVRNRGRLPTELVVQALDSVVTPPLGPPLPARETAVPDQAPPLPAAPPPAAETPPLRPVTELMDETRRTARD